jgi:hypothetical protein
MWFTYLKVHAAGGDLTYVLATAPSHDQAPAIRDTGVEQAGSLAVPGLDTTGGPGPVVVAVGAVVLLALVGGAVSGRVRGRRRAAADR